MKPHKWIVLSIYARNRERHTHTHTQAYISHQTRGWTKRNETKRDIFLLSICLPLGGWWGDMKCNDFEHLWRTTHTDTHMMHIHTFTTTWHNWKNGRMSNILCAQCTTKKILAERLELRAHVYMRVHTYLHSMTMLFALSHTQHSYYTQQQVNSQTYSYILFACANGTENMLSKRRIAQ